MRNNEAAALVIVAVYVALIVLMIASMWRIFTKAGKPGWAALVPIYNTIVLLEICGKPAWWILLLLIPFVSIIFAIILFIELAKVFGKGAGYAVGLILLSPIFFPMLAFGDARYIGPEGEGRRRRRERDDYDDDYDDRPRNRFRGRDGRDRDDDYDDDDRPRRRLSPPDDDFDDDVEPRSSGIKAAGDRAAAKPPPVPVPAPPPAATGDASIVACSSCGKKLKVPASAIGKKVKCPSCGTAFVAGD